MIDGRSRSGALTVIAAMGCGALGCSLIRDFSQFEGDAGMSGDAGAMDAGSVDAGSSDGGVDGGALDAGASDAGSSPTDSGADAGRLDGGDPVTRHALAFDGDGDDIVFPTSPGDLGTSFTFEMWVRPTSADAAGPEGAILLWKHVDCDDVVLVWSGSEGGSRPQSFRFLVYAAGASCSWVMAQAPMTSTVGDWHHVAGVFEDGAMRLYLDGVLATSTSAGG